VEQTFATFLPKGGHPFVYINLEIDPQRVDVNVHPTKREVNFLNEDEIIEEICAGIRVKLAEVDTSRTFLTQSLLPGSSKSTLANPSFKPPSFLRNPSSSSSVPGKPLENALVRTDPSLRKITSMLPPAANSGPSSDRPSHVEPYLISPRVPTTCRLTTIKELRASVRDAMHATLTETLASHTYVGLVDPTRRIAAIQGGVKLFLVDYGMLCNEYFYQLGLTDFGNFGSIRFEPALDIKALVALAVKTERREQQASGSEDDKEDIEWEEVPELVTGQLVQRREMLLEYFAMEISADGSLLSIPLLIKGYTPSLAKLPRFLMRLGPCVNWNEEKACFSSFLRELAAFYTVEQLPAFDHAGGGVGDGRDEAGIASPVENEESLVNPDPNSAPDVDKSGEGADAAGDNDAEIKSRANEVQWALEHVLFPAFRARLVATKGLLRGVVEVADLKGLYRVFERC
jgi:DNA mismatch repair protein MLH1